jgi:hypothetical protein
MANSPQFKIDFGQVTSGLDGLNSKLDRAVAGVFLYHDSLTEAWMKNNAPWTDRTSAARNGLRAQAEHVPFKTYAIHIWHTVAYGIWLEVRFAGKNAILLPTLQDRGPKIMKTLVRLMDRLQ